MIDAGGPVVAPHRRPGPEFLALAPDLLAGVTPADLHAALVRAATPKPVPRVDLVPRRPHQDQRGRRGRRAAGDAARHSGRTTFRAMTEDVPPGIEVVVRFLAILEMYKQGLIELEQATTFGELSIVWLGEDEADGRRVGVDSYGD